MAILLADSFDFYTAQADAQFVGSPWASFPSNLTATTPYGAGQAAWFATGQSAQSNGFATNETTIYLALNIYSLSTFTGTNTQGFYITLMDVAANQVTLQWAGDGNFYVRAGGTAGTILNGAGWPHGMAATSWCHWQAKVVIDSATGSVELRKNNNPVDDYSITGINTRNGSTNSYANKVLLGTLSYQFYVDDVFINSATGVAPTGWPGQLRATQLMPNGDSSITLSNSVGSGPNYVNVNEAHMNSDTNYVFGATAGLTDVYNLTDLVTVPASIAAVVTRQSFKKSDTGARTATTHVVSGGTAVDGLTVNLATTYGWQNIYYPTDPNTSAAWTFAGVNALQIGPKIVA